MADTAPPGGPHHPYDGRPTVTFHEKPGAPATLWTDAKGLSWAALPEAIAETGHEDPDTRIVVVTKTDQGHNLAERTAAHYPNLWIRPATPREATRRQREEKETEPTTTTTDAPRRWTAVAAGVFGTLLVLAVYTASDLETSNRGGPIPMSEYGVPSLEGVWRGPSGTPLDYGRQQPAGQELEAAVNARRLTATRFSGDTGTRNLRALRRDNGIALTPWARVELQRLDGTRFGRSEADGPEDRNTWERCLTRGAAAGGAA